MTFQRLVRVHCFILVFSILCGIYSSTVFSATAFKPDVLWPQVTQSGRYFNFPKGITRDKAGLFYVADSGSHQIKVLTSQGELLRTWGGFGNSAGQFNEPWGIAVTLTGEVVVIDHGNSRIQVFDSEGNFLRQWANQGSNQGQLDHPTYIAIDQQNRIYVSDSWNKRVEVFSVQGEWLKSISSTLLYEPRGIAISSQGLLYVIDGAYFINAYDADGKHLDTFGGFGSDPGKLHNPEGLVFSDNDLLYVTEYSNHRVQVFDLKGQFIGGFGKRGSTGADLLTPFGMVIDSASNTLYVADSSNNRIQHFSLNGDYKGAWQSQGNGQGEFASPYAFTGPQGDIYVADQYNHRIQIFSQRGELKASFGGPGSGPGQFSIPSSIVFDKQNRIYISDSGNDRIQVFDAQGNYLYQWGSSGSANNQFSEPDKLLIGNDNLVYVTDSKNNQIKVFTLEGTWVRTWGSEGSGAGQFNRPDGIVMDAAGNIYVAEWNNNRIQVFDSKGNFKRQWGSFGSADGQFNVPAGLALSANGQLYVADAWNNRIQVFQPDGTFVESIGEAGTQPGQFGQPYTVSLADDNTLIVAEFANNRLQVLRKEASGASNKATYKAIILAGGGPSTETYHNALWDSTQLLSNNAYFALRAQGVAKDAIKYLTSGSVQNDLDGNGLYDDLEQATLVNLSNAITQWAADADDVLIYLNDHGGPGTFKINQHEVLTKEQLSQALASLQRQFSGKITVIIEACQSASFFNGLGAKNRFLIASADQHQPAVISNQGLNAFSYHFWYGIHTGQSLQQAFKRARQGMSQQEIVVNNQIQRQNAQLDADGNEVFDSNDYATLADYCVGKCLKLAADEPQVTSLTGSSTLTGETRYLLNAQVSSLAPISRAWAIINRPDSNHTDLNEPVSDLPEIELQCTSQGNGQYQCQGEYTHFDVNGLYSITFHARDVQARTSVPQAVITIEQKAGTGQSQPAVSVYNDQTFTLLINDVQYGNKHFQAELTHPSGEYRFSVKSVSELAAPSSQQPDQLNTTSLDLVLNKVSAFGRFFKVKLAHMGDFVFQLTTVENVSE